MRRTIRNSAVAILLLLPALAISPGAAQAQGRGNRSRPGGGGGDSGGDVTLSVELRARIQDFYSSHPETGAEALPPGIRKNLERGKALPPGIAKRSPPAELAGQLDLPEGYEIVEVGLDVFLVDVATNVIHDVLMDVIH